MLLSSPSRLEAWRTEKRAIKVALYVHPISIEFKQSTYIKASYRVKRTLIHIFCGHVLELIATGIFYEFLNIYKISRILREEIIVKYQRPKSHPIHDFKQKGHSTLKAISKLSKQYAFKTLGNI